MWLRQGRYSGKQSGAHTLRRPLKYHGVECRRIHRKSASHSLLVKIALQKVANPNTRAEGDDIFDAIKGWPASEDRLVSRSYFTHSASSHRLECTVRGQIASISSLAEGFVVRPLAEASGATGPRLNTKKIYVIQTVVKRAISYAFQSVAFQT